MWSSHKCLFCQLKTLAVKKMTSLGTILDLFEHVPKTAAVRADNHIQGADAPRFMKEISELSASQISRLRGRPLTMTKIISSGDFLKICLMFTYVYPLDYMIFREHIRDKIRKHIQHKGAPVFDQRRGVRMEVTELVQWFECVFDAPYARKK